MRHFIITYLLVHFFFLTYGQGCSDAGVCTAGSFQQNGIGPDTLTLEFGAIAALGDGGTLVSDLQFQAQYRISSKWSVQFRIPYRFIQGDLGTVTGLGDPTTMVMVSPLKSDKTQLTLNLGVKWKANDADRVNSEGEPLPMVYQTSLGTTDLLAGVSFIYNDTKAGIALQVPFGTNENGFVQENDNFAEAPFPTTNRLTRKPDLVIRVDQTFKFSEDKWRINAGALPIVHLENDTYVNSNGETVVIEGSKGLTLNITFGVTRNLINGDSFSLRGGFPLIVRDVRPAGLTRNWVVGLYYDFGI